MDLPVVNLIGNLFKRLFGSANGGGEGGAVGGGRGGHTLSVINGNIINDSVIIVEARQSFFSHQVISLVHIAADGTLIGAPNNISSVTDDGVGKWIIIWEQAYLDGNYYVFGQVNGGSVDFTKSIGGIGIHITDDAGLPADIDIEMLAIGVPI